MLIPTKPNKMRPVKPYFLSKTGQWNLSVVFFFLVFLMPGLLKAQVTVLVNFKPFPSVEKAAYMEDKVNWSDADYTDDRACTESFAAMELAAFLPKCTGIPKEAISLSMARKVPKEGDVIIIGSRHSNPLIKQVDKSTVSGFETEQSFRIHSFSENNRTITVIEGSDRIGTLYGVYAYLNRLGVQFIGLGDKGTVYPDELSDIHQETDITENPSFITRGFHVTKARGNMEFFMWMARNKLNLWTDDEPDILFLKKIGIKLICGGHVVQPKFLPPDGRYPYNHTSFSGDEKYPADPYPVSSVYMGDADHNDTLSYFEAHPEWYGMHNGIRSKNFAEWAGDNFCTSNKDAKEELAKNLINCLIDGDWKNADLVNFWMLDGGKWCECEKCQKDGIYTDRLFDVLHVVLNKLREARGQGRLNRPVEVLSLAYHETLPAPSRPIPEGFDYENFAITFFPIERCYVHAFADPSCTEVNKPLLLNYQNWTQGDGRFYKGSMFIGEYYNVSNFQTLPLLFSRMIATDIPWYYTTGARHFHYMHVPTRLWGTWTLNQYLLSQILWNTSVDADAVMDTYFKKYYPTTSEPTREFYRHLELASANFKAFKHYAGLDKYSVRRQLKEIPLGNEGAEIFPLDHLHYEEFHPVLNDGPDVVEMYEEYHQARKYIDQALFLCSDSLEQKRLLEDERRFAYGENMMEFNYHIIRTALFHQQHKAELAAQEFKLTVYYADKLRAIKDLVEVLYSDSNIKNGYDATYLAPVYDFFSKVYGGE